MSKSENSISALCKRLKQLRESSGFSQQAIAKKLDVSQSAYSQIESCQTSISLNHLKILANLYNVSYDWLIREKGPKELKNNYISLVNMNAKAGYIQHSGNISKIEDVEVFLIPGFKNGSCRIFEVEGDSMEPTLQNYDHIVCEECIDLENLFEGEIYVILSKDDITVKRIYLQDAQFDTFCLKSDNAKYKSYTLRKEEIKQLWQVKAKITKSLLAAAEVYDTRIDELEKAYDSLRKEFNELKKSI